MLDPSVIGVVALLLLSAVGGLLGARVYRRRVTAPTSTTPDGAGAERTASDKERRTIDAARTARDQAAADLAAVNKVAPADPNARRRELAELGRKPPPNKVH